jgi:hypothetical protein
MSTSTDTIEITVTIDRQRIADLLCAAFEGGIGYWACITGYDEPIDPDYKKYLDVRYVDYPLNQGGAVLLEEIESGKNVNPIHTLDMAAIGRGLYVMQHKYPRHFGAWLDENDDAITGDVFVQCCIFGEIVYG